MSSFFRKNITRREMGLSVGLVLAGYSNGGKAVTVEQGLDLLYYGIANITNKKYGGVGDGITLNDAAIAAAYAYSPNVFIPNGTFLLAGTFKASAKGLNLIGESRTDAILKASGGNFVVDLYAVNANSNLYRVSNLKIQGKNGIMTRFGTDVDFVNSANPIKSFEFDNVIFEGTYDVGMDVKAGTAVIPTWAELRTLGIGIHTVMNYRTKVVNCEFSKFGIGFSGIGNTLSKVEGSRFNKNARHIHDERTKWHGSAFGMGADNEYVLNDLLDSRRYGGVTFSSSYGTKFHNNYLENINRSGANSAATMVLCDNPSRLRFLENHLNAYLSYSNSQPFFVFNSRKTASAIGDVGGCEISGNYLTPFSNVSDTTVKFNALFDASSPDVALYINNTDWPEVTSANINIAAPKMNFLSAKNLHKAMKFGGTNSANEDLWIDNGRGAYYIKSVNQPFVFTLEVENPNLKNRFSLIFDVDDNATGNGRLFIIVTDSNGVILFNNFAFQGVKAPTKYYLTVTSAILESKKKLKIEAVNFSFIKVYAITLEPMKHATGFTELFSLTMS